MNIVRVDTKTGAKEVSASSWNRITCGDFHALDRMLTVVFADTGGSIVPKPVAPPAEAGSGSAGSGAGSGGNQPKSVLGGAPAEPEQIHKLLEPAGSGSSIGHHVVPQPNIGTGLGRATGSAATGSAATK
jgi:hypothetical protein